jgi:hypothetical protein
MRKQGWLPVIITSTVVATLIGCGGAGGSVSTSGGGPGPGPAPTEQGTARIDVNTETGAVKVTPLGEKQTNSLYTGSAVTISSSNLVNDPANTSVRKLKLTIKNNTGDTIGLDGANLIVDKLTTDTIGLFDLRPFVNVFTVVGPGTSSGDGPGPSVTVASPNGLARDSDGAVYISGFGDGTMRRLRDGFVSRIATGLVAPGGVDVLPGSGFVYAVEQSGHRLVRVPTAGGSKFVLAGSGVAGSADGSGTAAQFNAPRDMAILGTSAYICDFNNNKIRKVDNLTGSAGTVTTLNVFPAITAPAGIGTMSLGGINWLVVCSTSTHKVFLVNSANGQSFQIGGTGVAGFTDGTGNSAQFSGPSDVVAVGSSIFVADINNRRVRQMTLAEGGDPKNASNWFVRTLAGDGISGTGDGSGAVARFATPRHLVADGSGALLMSDLSSNTVRKVTPVSGVFPVTGTGTGTVGAVNLVDPDRYIPDPGNLQQRKAMYDLAPIQPAQSVTEDLTFAVEKDVKSFFFVVSLTGSSNTSAALDAVDATVSQRGSSDVNVVTLTGGPEVGLADGSAMVAQFSSDGRIDVTSTSTFVADDQNAAVRLVKPDGSVFTIAGSGIGVPQGGSGVTCTLRGPTGIAAVEGDLELFVTDYFGHVIYRLSRVVGSDPSNPLSWTVAIIGGAPDTAGNTDGLGNVARFTAPIAVAADPEGRTLFICDYSNQCIKKMTYLGGDKNDPNRWTVSYFAGSTSGASGFVDAVGTSARFSGPGDIDLSKTGDLFVTEITGHRVRRITANRSVSLLAGSTAGSFGLVDAAGGSARFRSPYCCAVDNGGYVYVGEFENALVRRVNISSGQVATVAGIASALTPVDGPGNLAQLSQIEGMAYDPKRGLVLFAPGCVRLVERIVRNGSS